MKPRFIDSVARVKETEDVGAGTSVPQRRTTIQRVLGVGALTLGLGALAGCQGTIGNPYGLEEGGSGGTRSTENGGNGGSAGSETTGSGGSPTTSTSTSGSGGSNTENLRSYSNGSACLPETSPFVQDRSNQPKDSKSDVIIQNVKSILGGNGFGIANYQGKIGVAKPDFGIIIQDVKEDTPFVKWQPQYWSDWYYPHCTWYDQPLPVGGSTEGNADYTNANNGDSHIITLIGSEPNGACALYEGWRWSTWEDYHEGGCQTTWKLDAEYPEEGRGESCTSADAAGAPIAPLTPTPEAVQEAIDNGTMELGVAIRATFPNEVLEHLKYSAPATHATYTNTVDPNVFHFGDFLRLRDDFDVSGFSKGAQVIYNTMKKRGVFIADGGHVFITLGGKKPGTEQHDGEWAGLGVDYDSLLSLDLTDFEVVERKPTKMMGDCVVSDKVLEPCGQDGLDLCVPSENRTQNPTL